MNLCWVCDSRDIVYVDVLKMAWCEKHYREHYMGEVAK